MLFFLTDMDKKLLGLMSLFFLSFALFAVMVVFEKPLSRLTRAKEDFDASPTHSLIFAWPLTVKADGVSTSTITVFVRSTKGKPLADKTVTIDTPIGNLREGTVISDKEGKAVFQLTSAEIGTAEIQAVVENTVSLQQKVTVKFEQEIQQQVEFTPPPRQNRIPTAAIPEEQPSESTPPAEISE